MGINFFTTEILNINFFKNCKCREAWGWACLLWSHWLPRWPPPVYQPSQAMFVFESQTALQIEHFQQMLVRLVSWYCCKCYMVDNTWKNNSINVFWKYNMMCFQTISKIIRLGCKLFSLFLLSFSREKHVKSGLNLPVK